MAAGQAAAVLDIIIVEYYNIRTVRDAPNRCKMGIQGVLMYTLVRKNCYTYSEKLLHLSEKIATLTRKSILGSLAFSVMRKFKNMAECGTCRDVCYIFGIRQLYIIVHGG